VANVHKEHYNMGLLCANLICIGCSRHFT